MRACEALKKGSPTLSFEFFPPKTKEQEEQLFASLDALKNFGPDFASITCGALGSSRDKTLLWAKQIKQHGIEPNVHLTCVAETKQLILAQLKEMKAAGINSILALRGDIPEGETEFKVPPDGFAHARDLVAFIRQQNFDFCLGVAGYPEGHRESASLDQDIKYLKQKLEAGADYIITQLFFDNKFYFDFVKKCRAAGITVPIIPGLMIITSFKQIKKLTEMCGATIPEELLKLLEQADGDKEAVLKIGVEHAVAQAQELLKNKVPGLHFFVMNKSGPVSQVLNQLKFGRQP